MVACSLPIVYPVAPAVTTLYQYPWITSQNSSIMLTLLDSEGRMIFRSLQKYLYRTSIGSLGMGQSSFGRYFIYKLLKNYYIQEELARICHNLHFEAIAVILRNFAFTGLRPCGFYNLTSNDFNTPISRFPRFVSNELIFPEKTVRVDIETSYIESLFNHYDRWGNRHGPSGFILILAYKYGDNFGVYQYASRSSEDYDYFFRKCLTDVNPLKTAFCDMVDAEEIVNDLITNESNNYNNM